MTKDKQKQPVYKCPECGLHYESEEIMEQCREWCAEKMSCNMDITRQSIELKSKR